MNEELQSFIDIISYKEPILSEKSYFTDTLNLPVSSQNKELKLITFKGLNEDSNCLLFKYNIFDDSKYPEMILLAFNKEYLKKEISIPFTLFKSTEFLNILDSCLNNDLFDDIEVEINRQLSRIDKREILISTLNKEAYNYNLDVILLELHNLGFTNISQYKNTIFINDTSCNCWLEINKFSVNLCLHPSIKKYFVLNFESEYKINLNELSSKLSLKKKIYWFVKIMGIINNTMQELISHNEAREVYRKLLKFINNNLENSDTYYRISGIVGCTGGLSFYLINESSLIETILVVIAQKESIKTEVRDSDYKLVKEFNFKYKEFKI